jgi:shikimate kinase
MNKIILLGYMGCGKSTVAHKLATITGISYTDLDLYIEEKYHTTIGDMFKEKGEIHFRKVEAAAFNELLQQPDKMIIGLGGGTPCYANNHEKLQLKNVASIYLKASIETLFNRLSIHKSKRPLIASMQDDELKEFIAKHLFDRSFYYNQAKHVVSVDEKTIDKTIADILKVLTQ